MAKKDTAKDTTKDTSALDWEAEKPAPEEFEINFEGEKKLSEFEGEKKPLELEGAVVLTEEQKQILLREEIKKANRPGYVSEEAETGKKKKKKYDNSSVDTKTRKVGSLASTITAIILTVVSFVIMMGIMGSGDLGKMIILGLFVVFPMEVIATMIALIVFISNVVFMCTGKFSFLVFFNFLLSIALMAANVLIFFMGAEIMFP